MTARPDLSRQNLSTTIGAVSHGCAVCPRSACAWRRGAETAARVVSVPLRCIRARAFDFSQLSAVMASVLFRNRAVAVANGIRTGYMVGVDVEKLCLPEPA